jgi:DegV family protein with EDD domain
MEFIMNEKSYLHYLDAREMSLDKFYADLKSGIDSKTAQINAATFADYFESYLKDGKDVLYIGFTSGMSGTYLRATEAAKELEEKYPDRKVVVVDSLCASVGEGLLMYYVGRKYKNEDPTLEELRLYAENLKMNCCHWFVVDDIEQLKRGGRISAVTATFAKALQIKPVISVDNEGKLINVGKIRGANGVYDALIKKMQRDGEDYKNQTVLIGHADNIAGAKELEKRVKPLVKGTMICDIGPVIGTHVGSGMLAILFLGKRNITM